MKSSETLSLVALCFFGMTCPQSAQADPKPRDYWPTKAWKTAKPETQGVDSEKLKKVQEFFKRDGATKGVVIVRGGYIIGEYYYQGFKATELHRSASVAKSFTSAVVGRAITKGDFVGVQKKVSELYPPAKKFKDLTVEHLLTMSSGIAWRNRRDKTDLFISESYEAFVKSKNLGQRPGRKFIYKPVDPILLSLTFKHVTGKTLEEYGREHLFKLLGMGKMTWNSDSKKVTHGAGGIMLCARDYARLGYLFLNKGRWGKDQILSKEWVERSTTYQTPDNKNYGYYWWHRRPKAPIPGDMYSARGSGGQRIVVVPSLDLVVVRVGENVRKKTQWDHRFMQLIVESIQKSAKKTTPSETAKKLYSYPQ